MVFISNFTNTLQTYKSLFDNGVVAMQQTGDHVELAAVVGQIGVAANVLQAFGQPIAGERLIYRPLVQAGTFNFFVPRMVNFKELFKDVIGRVVEEHVRYVEYGVSRRRGVAEVAAAHHVLFLDVLEVGLPRQIRNGRQANLRAGAVLGHPLGQVLAAV
nr:16 kDa protein [Calliteara abietis nucleopolyhedrovirus]